jgi:hypothetical protein
MIMKLSKFVSGSAMSLLLGTTVLVYAQDPKPQQDQPRPEEVKPSREEAKPPKPEDKMKPARNEEKPQEAKPERAERPAQKEEHAREEHTTEHRGGRIPDDKFRAHFGREHKVVINHPTIVEGRPRFQYSGFWFSIADPWPVAWAYTDDCYIDYVDGEYFLYDLLHPGVRIAIVVEL